MSKKLSYHKSVNYQIADPAKILAQAAAKATTKNLPFGFKEVGGTRGESAYVFDMGEMYGAVTQEGLGTKSLIAQAVYKETGELYFEAIAQDTVASIINDLVSVGARPIVISAYWSSSSYDWLADEKMSSNFIKGWRRACDLAGVTWAGGETQSLPDMIEKGTIELAGSAFGVISPKSNLVDSKKLQAGDAILLVESNGVHANGISLVREVAANLPDGYQTKLSSGKTLGEEVMRPTHLYARLVKELLDASLDIHYLSNITGHGWRKIMRASQEFTYRLDGIPEPEEIFNFIQKESNNSDDEMYGNYNMGAGYAIYLPQKDIKQAQRIAKELGLRTWAAGQVEDGPKQVVIKRKGITYAAEALQVR
jgi:phosphoribosylformylglycinamidine cyclo-ligase